MHEPPALRDPILAGLDLQDGDGPVLRVAGELARLTGAPLALLHAPSAEPAARDPVRAALERAAAPLRATTPVTLHVRASPSPVRALHEAAEELGASLVVAGGGVAGVGERLLHAAPCAVAVVPPGLDAAAWALRRIGVAFIDGPEGAEALALAARLARRAAARVRSYTVLDAAAAEGAERRLQAVLGKVRARVPADVLEATDVLEGEPAAELARVSADLDLLICGSRGYGPVRSLLLGGVSSTLAHTAACPLLVVPRAAVPGLRALTGDPVARPTPA